MFKKIALIVLFIAVTLGVGYLLYRLFFSAPAPTTTPPPTQQPGGPVTGLPTSGTGRPTTGTGGTGTVTGLPTASNVARGGLTNTTTVAANRTLQPQAAASGAVSFYNQDDGKFYRQMADGSVVLISDKSFSGVQKISWAPGSDKAILEFPDNSKVIYDFTTQKQVTLPSHWQEFSFAADGKSVAAETIGTGPDNNWLITFSADGSDAQLIEPLGNNADKVIVSYSPNNQVIAFSDTGGPVGFDTRDMIVLGKNNENFKALTVEGFGFTPAWSPSGAHLIYSVAGSADGYLPTIWFSDAQGDTIGNNRSNLGVHTWADKCTYADEASVYCAVPTSLPEGAGLQREIADNIPDSIVKIDLKNGTTSQVGRPVNDITIKNLVVASDGSKLYFTDASSGHLESMNLR